MGLRNFDGRTFIYAGGLYFTYKFIVADSREDNLVLNGLNTVYAFAYANFTYEGCSPFNF